MAAAQSAHVPILIAFVEAIVETYAFGATCRSIATSYSGLYLIALTCVKFQLPVKWRLAAGVNLHPIEFLDVGRRLGMLMPR